MPDGIPEASLKLVSDITAIDASAWDACAGPDNPFLSHAFLSALEESGSATAEAGWLPQHLVLEEPDGRLLGAVPLYLKGHSYGEYVFDHSWARAYEQAGGRYYPKLQSAVPFTPVTGPRLLVRPGAPAATAELLIRGLEQAALAHKVSSLHVTFPTEADWSRFGEAGWLQRIGEQYHWENEGYGSFDDFLATLNSRRRKDIRKERQRAVEGGIRLTALTGDDLKPQHWDAFFRFYRNTSDRKWGDPYLTRDFFARIGETMADRIALVMAEKDGRWIAGALNLIGSDTIYGRNWGCDGRDYPFLHFEACYYQAIDFAIARGLKRVEAGAQGGHKVMRGYRPVRTYSAHWIRDPGFRRAVADFLARETRAVDAGIEDLAEHLPFRQTCP
ncbi:GNAT family N-acetyltransferase [Inquilinus limosus]|uniref:GNAT family N-acetyltransferase n=1 Tax=Inquilinus limosus TaxID=171674 RepID=UPI003F136969